MFHFFLIFASFFQPTTAYSNLKPSVHYTLTINVSDLSGYDVEMAVTNAPANFHLAMVAHPEYDDRFWRYLNNLVIDGLSDNIIRKDSALWLVKTNAGNHIVSYRINLPPAPAIRGSWRPFLSPSGGLVGGPHSFLYILGATQVPSSVTFKLPGDWQIATSLHKTKNQNTFYSPSVESLVDAPAIIGIFKDWTFKVKDAIHHLIYWALPNAASFDSDLVISQLSKMAEQSAKLFGGFPYKEYYFLLQDGAYGGLEHHNSVTIGATPEEIRKDTDILSEISHEYFHTWNLVRIHPAEFHDVVYKDPPLAKELWWSEGLTMFYSDLLLRRAKLPVQEPTRIAHLERILKQYFDSPGNQKLSPVEVSRSAFARPGMLGDYDASTHIQGELIGTMLDLIMRDVTNGNVTIDDVMRTMMKKYNGGRGFTSTDVQHIIEEKCHCNVHPFFKDHIYGNKPIDINKYLQLIGLRSEISYTPAGNENLKATPDQRIYAWQREPGITRIIIIDPTGIWGSAGLHTNDEVIRVNETLINSTKDFYSIIRSTQIGDSVRLELNRPGGIFRTQVIVKSYEEASVKIDKVRAPTTKQLNLYREWETGN